MTTRTPIVNSSGILEALQEIQRREGRQPGVSRSDDDLHDHFTVEGMPFYEAPCDVAGIVRLRHEGRAYIKTGQRCRKCPISRKDIEAGRNNCMCYGYCPTHWIRLPKSWLP